MALLPTQPITGTIQFSSGTGSSYPGLVTAIASYQPVNTTLVINFTNSGVSFTATATQLQLMPFTFTYPTNPTAISSGGSGGGRNSTTDDIPSTANALVAYKDVNGDRTSAIGSSTTYSVSNLQSTGTITSTGTLTGPSFSSLLVLHIQSASH